MPPFGWMTDGALQLGSRFYSLLVATIPCGTTLTMRHFWRVGDFTWLHHVASCTLASWWWKSMNIGILQNMRKAWRFVKAIGWCPNWPFANSAGFPPFPGKGGFSIWDVAGHLPTGKHLSLSLRSSGLSEVWGGASSGMATWRWC